MDNDSAIIHGSPYIARIASPHRIPKREHDDEALEERSLKKRSPQYDDQSNSPTALAPAMFGHQPSSPAPPSPTTPATIRRPPVEKTGPTTLVRTSQLARPASSNAKQDRVNLFIKKELNDMSVGWCVVGYIPVCVLMLTQLCYLIRSDEEYGCRRRLVQFWRRQDGSTLHLAFCAIKPSEFRDTNIVISCIYRDGPVDECYVTSVDIIYLLESLIGNRFTVEEKNRIRRNLEGFKPQTISKHKRGQEDFFSLIMGFPNPRPRNIEKDVKVFPWKLLQKALEKIVTKYVRLHVSFGGHIALFTDYLAIKQSFVSANGSLVEDVRSGPSRRQQKEEPEEDELIDSPVVEEEAAASPPYDSVNRSTPSPSRQHIRSGAPAAAAYPHSPTYSDHSYASSSAVTEQDTLPQSNGHTTSAYSSTSLVDIPPQGGRHRRNEHSYDGTVEYNDDAEVDAFFHYSTGYTGTGSGHSPQSHHSELDGIHGRSFHHRLQQQSNFQQQQSQSHSNQQSSQAPSAMYSSPPTHEYGYAAHHVQINEAPSGPIHRSHPPLYAPVPSSRIHNLASLMLPDTPEKHHQYPRNATQSPHFPSFSNFYSECDDGNRAIVSGSAEYWGGVRDFMGLGDDISSPGIDPTVGVSS